MLTYIIRRLLLMIPTLIGISFIVFLVMAWSPGGVAATLAAQEGHMRPELRKALHKYYNKRYGLKKPVLVQYGRWLNQVSPIGFKVQEDDVPVKETVSVGSPTTQASSQPATTQSAASQPTASQPAAPQMVPKLKRDSEGNVIKDEFGDPVVELEREAGEVLLLQPTFKWPNLGESYFRQKQVAVVILDAVPITLLLNFITIPIVYIIAIWSGIWTARYRGKIQDVGTGVVLVALWSLPTMWVGVMFIGFLANKDIIQLFPTDGLHDTLSGSMKFLPSWGPQGFARGWLLDMTWHLILPVTCLTYASFAFLSKLMRGSMLENLSADFVRTARAKGLDSKTVLYRHVFRNSLLPLITIASGIIPGLLGGSVVVETIFSYEGMGKLMVDAVTQRDRELILGETLVISIISLLCLLVTDLLYAAADPRVSYD